ncbi:hypothetical protein HPP92_016730 [Vanilla planifolia]|uniref:Uncharacterized protein n=1 Tax=Vanilla planifolia TaxID=51239 RepID=A0A835QBE5_VANPL|nr:hypothetical protein HPP92_016730 [Vanilla planifolia]
MVYGRGGPREFWEEESRAIVRSFSCEPIKIYSIGFQQKQRCGRWPGQARAVLEDRSEGGGCREELGLLSSLLRRSARCLRCRRRR